MFPDIKTGRTVATLKPSRNLQATNALNPFLNVGKES